jgi:hypothetical protein
MSAPTHRVLIFAASALLCATGVLAGLATRGTPPVAAQNQCGNAVILEPTNNASISGKVPVMGSALIDDFNFYKVEYAPAYAPDSWAAVSTVIDAPTLNGLLDSWDTTAVPDGQYSLKLTVVNHGGEEVCRAFASGLYVGNQATATPSPTVTPEESPTATATFEIDAATEVPTPLPTAEPIIPSESGGQSFSPQTVRGIADAFVKGFLAALLVSAAGLLIYALRR